MREESILLPLVEAVDLGQKKDRLSADLEPLLGLRHHFAYSWNSFCDGREGDEVAVSVLSDQSAGWGLAGAGWSPENHGADGSLLYCVSERFSGRQEVFLSNKLLERPRAHAGGQR